MKNLFYSSGKLIISGEYLVLNGAKALALPTRFGQQLHVETLKGSGNIHWTALNSDGNVWLNVSFILLQNHLLPVQIGSPDISSEVILLKKILENALTLNPDLINTKSDYEIVTKLEFPLKWGLGSSSTLICNIAQWAGIDPYELFFKSLNGSAYDIAVGIEQKPLIYQLNNGNSKVEIIDFLPSFSNEIYFVYLNQKQKSDIETIKYLESKSWNKKIIEEISDITVQISKCTALPDFESLIIKHESILSEVLKTETIKSRLFNDYTGAVKSLGAWGGDFVLATGCGAKKYFISKGYKTVLTWDEMIRK